MNNPENSYSRGSAEHYEMNSPENNYSRHPTLKFRQIDIQTYVGICLNLPIPSVVIKWCTTGGIFRQW